MQTDLAPGAAIEARPRGRAIDGLTVVVACLALVLVALRFVRLDAPPAMIFDEIYYAKAAQQILARVEVTEERTHPPLSKLIIAAGIRLAGDRALGWRIAGAVAGAFLPLVVAALAWVLFRDHFAAAAAALLMAADGLVFVESRIAKPDILLTLFLFSTYLALWQYLRGRAEPDGGQRNRALAWVYLAGIAAGCAVTTKWTTVVPLLTVPLTLGLAVGLRAASLRRGDLLHLAAAFVAVPAGIYLVSYIPYFMLGHGLRDLAAQQAFMFRFHAGLKEGHPYQSAWWSWPLLLRPIWYEYREVAPQVSRGILAIGNPVIWWAALPAFALAAVRAARARGLPELFVLVGFAVSYLQYAFISRVLFLYHFLPALPFLVLALAAELSRLRARGGGGIVAAYFALVVVWLAAFYPVLASLPVAAGRFFRLMWFGSWI